MKKDIQKASSELTLNRLPFHRIHGIIQLIVINDIVYCEGDVDITKVKLRNGTEFKAIRNIGYYQKLLEKDHGFLRIGKKLLLNLNYLESYVPRITEVSLKNGESKRVARRGGQKLRKYLNTIPNTNSDTRWYMP